MRVKLDFKWFALGIAVGLIIGTILVFVLLSFHSSSYKRIKLIPWQTRTIIVEGNEYQLTYEPYPSQHQILLKASGYYLTYKAIEGEKYQVLGIEIVVSEVHPNDYLILLIRPL